MSFIAQFNEIKLAKSKLAAAEEKLVIARTSALNKLPSDFGFKSLKDFIKALKAASGKAKKGTSAKPAKAPKKEKKTKAPKGRTKLTAELKAQVVEAFKANKTAAEICAAFGISIPSIQKIKKDAGLVKARSAKVIAEPALVSETA